jgi:hypothetical protein
MKKRIGCLHAHHSNIDYIESSLSHGDYEFMHFVDPGLVHRLSSTDGKYEQKDAKRKVHEQIEWMEQCNVDAILLTCTNYIAVLGERSSSVPLIKIAEPFFKFICSQDQPQALLFSNPATVEGTMQRLYQLANQWGKSPSIQVHVIENIFELLLQGKKAQYVEKIADYIRAQLLSSKDNLISVAQLSMVEAVQAVEKEMNIEIGNPLRTLSADIKILLL